MTVGYQSPSGVAFAVVVALCAGTEAQGQSLKRSVVLFPWDPLATSARAQGLGGADVSVVADASSVGANAAGLAFLPLHSVSLSLLQVTRSQPRDRLAQSQIGRWDGPLNIDVGFRPWNLIGIGFQFGAPTRHFFEGSQSDTSVGLHSLREHPSIGLALSVRAGRQFGFGARVGKAWLQARSRSDPPLFKRSLAAPSWSLGLLARPFDHRTLQDVRPFSGLQFGLTVAHFGEWRESAATVESDAGQHWRVERASAPVVSSLGVSWHRDLGWGQKILVSTQIDRVEAIQGRDKGYAFATAVEFSTFRRGRVEGNGGLQLRAGFRRKSRAMSLVVFGLGPGSIESIEEPGRSTLSVGLSAVPSWKSTGFAGRLRLDTALSRSQSAWRWSVGLNLQFPRSQRRTLLGG